MTLLERVEQMLTGLEWSDGASWCPVCDCPETSGDHAPDCALAALLADVRKEIAEGKLFEKRPGDGDFSEFKPSDWAVPPGPEIQGTREPLPPMKGLRPSTCPECNGSRTTKNRLSFCALCGGAGVVWPITL